MKFTELKLYTKIAAIGKITKLATIEIAKLHILTNCNNVGLPADGEF